MSEFTPNPATATAEPAAQNGTAPVDTPPHAVRRPDGTWILHLATTADMEGRSSRERELRGIVQMAARELASLGGENCPEQIGYRVARWASEALVS